MQQTGKRIIAFGRVIGGPTQPRPDSDRQYVPKNRASEVAEKPVSKGHRKCHVEEEKEELVVTMPLQEQ